MKKVLTAIVIAATLGLTALATSSPASAWWRGGWGWRGCCWGPGPFVAGAVVGAGAAAWAYRPYYYGYYPYGPYPYGYYGCRRVWNGYAWVSACY